MYKHELFNDCKELKYELDTFEWNLSLYNDPDFLYKLSGKLSGLSESIHNRAVSLEDGEELENND